MCNICTWPLKLYQLEIKSHGYWIGIRLQNILRLPQKGFNSPAFLNS